MKNKDHAIMPAFGSGPDPSSQRELTRAIIERRGIFDKETLRVDLEQLIIAQNIPYYRLEDETGHLHFLLQSVMLIALIDWLMKYPRLSCTVNFLPPRKLMKTSNRVSVAALSDADILTISRLQIRDANTTLHFYDRVKVTGVHRARLVGAPMRDVNFDDLQQSYRGYCAGEPACVIVKDADNLPPQIAHPKHFDQEQNPPTDLGPIDIVYTWVNSDDPIWRAKFAKHIGQTSKTTHASKLRYLSRDELRYSLRSVLKHAPWVRNIFIVTDDQCPKWLKTTDRVKIISHREIFPDPLVLPVFNSHAIESCLHHIPGLSERFVYFNDDVFLGDDVAPTDFFGPDGSVKLFFSGHLSFNPQFIEYRHLPTDAAFRNTIREIEKRFGMTPVAKVQHTPHAMRKSILETIESEHAEEIALTRAARIRSDTDLNVTGNLAYYYCVGLGKADWHKRGKGFYRYIDTGRTTDMRNLFKLVAIPTKFFCLNLTQHQQVPLKRQAQLMRILFYLLYRRRAHHERSRISGAMSRLREVWEKCT